MQLIKESIELKEKTQIGGDIYKNISPQLGNPGDFLVTTQSDKQYILPKELFHEIVGINHTASHVTALLIIN